MNTLPQAGGGPREGRSDRFHRWRRRKDSLARWMIAFGGVGVIGAVVLIFFYLLYVVYPLLQSADAQRIDIAQVEAWSGQPSPLIALEEQLEVGMRLGPSGDIVFFSVDDGRVLSEEPLRPATGAPLGPAAAAGEGNGLVAAALPGGEFVTFRHRYETNFEGGVENRRIVPQVDYPYGEDARTLSGGAALTTIAVSDTESELVVAGTDGDALYVEWGSKQENFLTGSVELDRRVHSVAVDFRPTGLALSGNHRWLYAADGEGRIHRFALPGLEPRQVVQVSERPITAMAMLLGGISVLAGDAGGAVTQLFPVRDADNEPQLQVIRRFELAGQPVVRLVPEQRRKGFAAVDDTGRLGIFHSTSERKVLERVLAGGPPTALALSPRANGLLLLEPGGRLALLRLDNEHPEVSFKSLWQKVWYENYTGPEFVWQSSASTNEFEPKFSLSPLAFGTLKAALYAMLFAVPLALLGAAYTAYFMAPEMRQLVKPTIEIMAALPTVILGFLAGLWFAPFVEQHLAGIFATLLILPVGLLLFSYLWTLRPSGWFRGGIDGWEAALLLPVLIALVAFSMALAQPLEAWFFGGDLRTWFSQAAGISYDQRNALVVGVAMGFAVIPTIFSIAEDAVFGVPKSLSDGSLALGATRWQTLVRVVLPTASPGIFSALMIGLGRAVGETMIVLMATGNTPVMDWNLFEGMRTLAANIAVEMPESEVASTHYRILFLAALVLFLFTFVVNTGAELIRQRLRDKYSSL